MTDLRFDSIPLAEHLTPQARAWGEALKLGFHRPAPSDEEAERWWQCVLSDRQRLTGVYDDNLPTPTTDPRPVATFSSFDLTVNTGSGRLVTCNFISDVTVRPTHRRRGLLRQLISADLAAAVERGVPFASLTAIEGSVYGRFGFGVATREHRVEVATAHDRFQFRTRLPGRVVMVNPADCDEIYRSVFQAFHRSHRGSHERPAHYIPMLNGTYDWRRSGTNRALRTAVHYDEQSVPDGYVVYTVNPDQGELQVRDLVAVTDEAELGLWQFLGDIDLVKTIGFRGWQPGSPLRHALVNPRVVKVVGDSDVIWLRILDPEAALALRGYDADGSLRLGVTDPMGYAAGT